MTAAWYKEIVPFKFEQYSKIDLDRLTAYAIKFLIDNDIEPFFENIVVALYKLFPKSFSLVGFSEYPDSNRVNRQLLHCRPKYRNYVIGGMRRGWVLTEKGRGAAEETERLLSKSFLSTTQKRRRIAKERTKSIHFVNEILRSEAYMKYLEGKLGNISDIELCDVLHANLDTPISIVANSIRKLVDYAKIVENEDVIHFLEFAEERLVQRK